MWLMSEIKNFLDAYFLFLVFACIYLIEYRYDLNENLFPKKVIAMPITLEFLKTLQQNLILNYRDQFSKI